MKTLFVIVLFFITYIGLFLLFSLLGLIWTSYYDSIMDQGWFGVYTVFLGWWLAAIPCRLFYKKHKSYFTQMFEW